MVFHGQFRHSETLGVYFENSIRVLTSSRLHSPSLPPPLFVCETGKKCRKFASPQRVQDALPSASVTLYLALLQLYKNGGIYVDLTTFFVRPLPEGVDGFVVGGQGGRDVDADGTAEGENLGCSLQTVRPRMQRALVMQVGG